MAVVRRLPSTVPIDDAALARLVAAKDPRAAAALWDRYAVLVRGIVRRTLGPGADVEDLVQDAFIGLFRTLPGLRDPDALRSFIVGTALRVAHSELRRRRVRRWMSLTPTGITPDRAQPGAADPEARRAVKRLYEVLDKVDDRGRMAFVLRHMEGYELTEVADSLGCSLATAKRSLAKAQERVNAMVRRDSLLAPYLRESREGHEGGRRGTMSRKGTERVLAMDLEGLSHLVELARDATTGEVSERVHVAGRANFLGAVERETEGSSSRAPMRIAFAIAAVVALVVGGWGLQRWRAPEWTVDGAVASEGFVRAPATAAATIAFAEGSAVVLSPATRARVVRGDRRHVVLEDGRAEVRIARGPILAWAFDAGPFSVRASQGGLAMAWSGDEEQLDVWPHDAETTVQGGVAGAGVTLHGGDHLIARVRQGELRIVRADGAVTTPSGVDGAPLREGSPSNSEPAATAPSAARPAPDAIASAPPAAPTAPPVAAASAPSHLAWSSLVSRGDYDSVLRDADASGIESVLSHRPLADLAALADASRYRGQTELAQRALTTERTRFPGSKEAHTAAFLLGRLADDQSHDPARAIAWYTRYLGEAPSGPFASEALGRKMIAVQTSQGPDAAKPIADQYARRFPHGAYAAQAEEIRTR